MKPKISIITPSYNQSAFLEETIDSVLSQGYPNLEYVIIDGGSKDGSVEIIKKYQKHLKYWVSEADQGQTDAINKGLKHCTGEIFNWINSDDILEKKALKIISDSYKEEHFDVFAGIVLNFNSKGLKEYVQNLGYTPDHLLLRKFDQMNFHQPGVWWPTEKVKQLGGLPMHLNYSFDWYLMIKLLLNFECKIIYTDEILARFRLHEGSKTVSWPIEFQKEAIITAREFKDHPGLLEHQKEIKEYIHKKSSIVEMLELSHSDLSKKKKLIKMVKYLFSSNKPYFNRFAAGKIKEIYFS